MSALWAAAAATAVIAATSLDLASILVRAAGTAAPTSRRRVLRAAASARVALVVAAWFVALALMDVPVAVVGVLGVVPIVFGVLALRRRVDDHHVAVAGAPSAFAVTLASGGDDVAAWLVLLRWQVGHAQWPVDVVLVLGAIAVPWLVGVAVRRGPAERTARTLAAAAPLAQIAIGAALLALSVAGVPR